MHRVIISCSYITLFEQQFDNTLRPLHSQKKNAAVFINSIYIIIILYHY